MFTLKIATDNAAFSDWPSHEVVADMLEAVARKLRDGRDAGAVMDPNGNAVGVYRLTGGR